MIKPSNRIIFVAFLVKKKSRKSSKSRLKERQLIFNLGSVKKSRKSSKSRLKESF